MKAENSPEKKDFLKSIIISLSIKSDSSGLHEHRLLRKWGGGFSIDGKDLEKD